MVVPDLFRDDSLIDFSVIAGTHDLQLAIDTLQAFRTADSDVYVPRYDKSQRAGRGDRSPRDLWTKIEYIPEQPVDVVLFEGWMLGFTSLHNQHEQIAEISTVASSEAIQEIDQHLVTYKTLHDLFDAWLVLAVQDVSIVYKWRLQAEVEMRSSGKPSLTDQQVADFVSRFMPAYETYLPFMYEHGPERRSTDIKYHKLTMGQDRYPVAAAGEEAAGKEVSVEEVVVDCETTENVSKL